MRFEENQEDRGAKHIRQRETAKKVSFGLEDKVTEMGKSQILYGFLSQSKMFNFRCHGGF